MICGQCEHFEANNGKNTWVRIARRHKNDPAFLSVQRQRKSLTPPLNFCSLHYKYILCSDSSCPEGRPASRKKTLLDQRYRLLHEEYICPGPDRTISGNNTPEHKGKFVRHKICLRSPGCSCHDFRQVADSLAEIADELKATGDDLL